MTRALVTGATGQDGSLLCELLASEGVEIVGLVRPGDDVGREPNLARVAGRLAIVEGDLLDLGSLRAAVLEAEPDELYHLAAPTFVPRSWEEPAETFLAIPAATAALLDAARELPVPPRIVVAASSEVFGDAGVSPQDETSPMRPRTPYGAAKLAALHVVRAYRARYGLHAGTAITYNHESERRPERFVTRKVTRGTAAIKLGRADELVLGDMSAVRDWSAARDVVRGYRAMAAASEPGDYVLASGRGHTVADLVAVAFRAAGLDADEYVRVDAGLVRGAEETPPIGDPARAANALGWRPRISFEELIGSMVDADLAELGAHAGSRSAP